MKPKRILVVSGKHELMTEMTDDLEADGFRVSQAENVAEGMELARLIRPDLVLLDGVTSVGQGFVFAEELKKDTTTKGIPVVFLFLPTSIRQKSGLHLACASRYITLPVEKNELVEIVKEAITETSGSTSEEVEEQPTILVVESGRAVKEYISEILAECGFNVETAKSGLEAVEKACKIKPEAVILNLVMPDMDGFEVCEMLCGNPETAGIPIILESAKSDIGTVARAFAKGAKRYLIKPFTAVELLQMIRDVLDSNR